MRIIQMTYLFIITLLAPMMHAFTAEMPFDRILGSNREEMINYIKQFPIENYKIYDVPSSGRFYLDPIDDYIKGVLRSGKPWEPQIKDLILQFAKPESIVLDIGAHIGTHTIAMSECVGPQGHVLAFEPQPKIFRELFFNMMLNEKTNVKYYPVAVGAQEGTIELSPLFPGNEAGTSLVYGGTGEFAPLITIDSLQLNDVSLMKIDVELQENSVLEGARNTINRCRPVIIIEIHGECSFQQASKKVREEILFTISKLQRMGYSVSCIGHADYLALPN